MQRDEQIDLQIGVSKAEVPQKKEWVTPQVGHLAAGSAEFGATTNPDLEGSS